MSPVLATCCRNKRQVVGKRDKLLALVDSVSRPYRSDTLAITELSLFVWHYAGVGTRGWEGQRLAESLIRLGCRTDVTDRLSSAYVLGSQPGDALSPLAYL